MMIDEGPSPEDLARFGGDDDGDYAYCPSCGEEVYDDIAICPYCGEAIRDGQRFTAEQQAGRQRWIVVVVTVVLVAFIYLALRLVL